MTRTRQRWPYDLGCEPRGRVFAPRDPADLAKGASAAVKHDPRTILAGPRHLSPAASVPGTLPPLRQSGSTKTSPPAPPRLEAEQSLALRRGVAGRSLARRPPRLLCLTPELAVVLAKLPRRLLPPKPRGSRPCPTQTPGEPALPPSARDRRRGPAQAPERPGPRERRGPRRLRGLSQGTGRPGPKFRIAALPRSSWCFCRAHVLFATAHCSR